MIKREVMRDRLRNWRDELLRGQSLDPPLSRRRRSSALNVRIQDVPPLLYVNGSIADYSHESMPDLLPMKDLAGIERHRQIEIRCGNLDQFHRVDRVVLNAMSVQAPKAQLL